MNTPLLTSTKKNLNYIIILSSVMSTSTLILNGLILYNVNELINSNNHILYQLNYTDYLHL